MPAANPYFEILHLDERVELRPSLRLIRNKQQSAGCLLVFMLLLLGYYWWTGDLQLNRLWIWCVILMPIWLIVVYVNRRLCREATVPLIIAPGPHLLHGETLLSTRIEYQAVQLGSKENYDNPDTYNVLLVPAQGESVTLPRPYFGDLDFEAAVLLANEVAKLLQIPFERNLMPPK